MTKPSNNSTAVFHFNMSEFWSGDLGLTLVTISLTIFVFVITPLREAGLPGRIVFDLVMVSLMVFGALTVEQRRSTTVLIIAFVLLNGVVLAASRFHPTPFLQLLGSALSTITLLIYARIVLLVMFRGGPVTWSRIQGSVCAYLLIGLAWASAYGVLEQLQPGSFRFVSAPENMDQLSSKLTYFSFTTLTTVGGDVTPFLPMARSMAIAESIVGQLFPAILIGALVAMAMQARPKA
jgi:voltage-gated potassium channel